MKNDFLLQEIAERTILTTWHRLARKHKKLRSFPIPSVCVSGSLKKSLGLTHFEDNKIKLSKQFFNDNINLFMSDIIPHEVAHIAAYLLYNDIAHGKKWEKIMRDLSLNPSLFYVVK
jgi:SprT protein